MIYKVLNSVIEIKNDFWDQPYESGYMKDT